MTDKSFQVIRIVSSVQLDEEKAAQIARPFASHFHIQDYEVRNETDSSLLGGMVIYAGGFRYDYSIRGQLSRISNQLKTQKSIGADEDIPDVPAGDLIRENLDQALSMFAENPVAPGNDTSLWNTDTAGIEGEEDTSRHIVDRLRESLESFLSGTAVDEIGQVIRISDGMARVRGIQNCNNNELIQFGAASYGIAMNLEEEEVGVVLLQEDDSIRQGSLCKRTGRTVMVPAGKNLLGRVVDALGQPLDGMGPISAADMRPVENPAATIIDRKPVTRSLHTGITAIDAMTPIGKGQRELIIGDRQTGKTAIALDTIISQKGKNVFCIYVAIGQKMSTIATVVNTLEKYGAMKYTTVVAASAGATAPQQYLAPYSGCAMAEELMYKENSDVLVIYDDLTKHAQAYRAISLLLRRPPGREAYPGDIFYLHARLLERATQLNDNLGGGSITALPIVETQSGDISAYIPTNVISITDGQIYLESELFHSGQRPAINVGLSVSRVGGAAQIKAMKEVAGPLRIKLAQYRELEAFAQFGSELDPGTRLQLKTGSVLIEVLKQEQYAPQPVANQVIMLHLATNGYLTSLDTDDVKKFLDDFLLHLSNLHPALLTDLALSGKFSDEDKTRIKKAIDIYLERWLKENEDYGPDN